MKLNDMYPSKYIKADDLQGQRLPLTVMSVTMEDIGGDGNSKEFKPVMRFMAKDKGMVLNKTNATLCAMTWGDDTDTWQGRELELFAAPVMYQGKQVMGLSVAPKLPSTQPPVEQPQSQPGPHDHANPTLIDPTPTAPDNIDDIPF